MIPTGWHICWRAALGRCFAGPGELADLLLCALNEAHRRRGRRLINFLILPSEVHVLTDLPQEDDPSSLARLIGTSLSRHVLRAQPVHSPVLAGPGRHWLIRGVPDLRRELLMLAWRPVLRGASAACGQYLYEGTALAMSGSASASFDARPLLELFGDEPASSFEGLSRWLKLMPTEQAMHAWELHRGLGLANRRHGARAAMGVPVTNMGAAELVAMAGKEGVDGALRLIEQWVRHRLHLPAGLNLDTLPSPDGPRSRALVACIAVNHGLCPAGYVARHYKRSKGTLSVQMSEVRRRPMDSWLARTSVATIIEFERSRTENIWDPHPVRTNPGQSASGNSSRAYGE